MGTLRGTPPKVVLGAAELNKAVLPLADHSDSAPPPPPPDDTDDDVNGDDDGGS